MTDPRTAIVTGASKGLGRALAVALADAGWLVVADARDATALHAIASSRPGRIIDVHGDITDPAHRTDLVGRALTTGRLDLLVNNAGGLGPSPLPPLAELDSDALRDLLEVNVVAPLAVVRASLPHLRVAKGAIINVTSDAAVEGYPGWGAYGATKAALEQASRVLATEEPDIAVWWVDPGDMRTEMHQAAFPGEDISDRPEPETSVPGLLRLVTDRPPSGRYLARELTGATT